MPVNRCVLALPSILPVTFLLHLFLGRCYTECMHSHPFWGSSHTTHGSVSEAASDMSRCNRRSESVFNGSLCNSYSSLSKTFFCMKTFVEYPVTKKSANALTMRKSTWENIKNIPNTLITCTYTQNVCVIIQHVCLLYGRYGFL